jgi:hypothetical protein
MSTSHSAAPHAQNRTDEECLADEIASIILARDGLPPNETPDYTVHDDCESFWGGAADVIRPRAATLAAEVLAWASATEPTRPGCWVSTRGIRVLTARNGERICQFVVSNSF